VFGVVSMLCGRVCVVFGVVSCLFALYCLRYVCLGVTPLTKLGGLSLEPVSQIPCGRREPINKVF